MNSEKNPFLVSILFLCLAKSNLIINGDFESIPVAIDVKTPYTNGSYPGWDGSFEIAGTLVPPAAFSTQYVDMAIDYNGELFQNVDIVDGGSYLLAFDQIGANTTYDSFNCVITWDNKTLGQAHPMSTSVERKYFQFLT